MPTLTPETEETSIRTKQVPPEMPALNIVKITPIEILQNQDGVKGQLDNKDEQVNNKNSFWNLYGLIPKINIFSQKTTTEESNTDSKPTADNSKYDAETQKLIEGKLFTSPLNIHSH